MGSAVGGEVREVKHINTFTTQKIIINTYTLRSERSYGTGACCLWCGKRVKEADFRSETREGDYKFISCSHIGWFEDREGGRYALV